MNEEKINLCSLRATLKKPRVVAERSHRHCWFPDLLLNHGLNPDRIDSNCRSTYFR